jgi:cytochrome P450
MRLLNPKDMKLLNRKEQFGPVFKTNFLYTATVMFTDETSIAQLAREEAANSKRNALQAFFPPHHQKMYGPNSLLVQSGPNYARIRKLVMSSMTPNMIARHEPLVAEAIQSFFCILETYREKNEGKGRG